MSNITGTVRAKIAQGKTPKNYNNITVATVESSQLLSAGTKQFIIRARGNSEIKYAWVATETTSNFITVPKGTTRAIENLDFTGTIYFQTNVADVVEIEEWV